MAWWREGYKVVEHRSLVQSEDSVWAQIWGFVETAFHLRDRIASFYLSIGKNSPVGDCSASLISQLSPPNIWLWVFIIKNNWIRVRGDITWILCGCWRSKLGPHSFILGTLVIESSLSEPCFTFFPCAVHAHWCECVYVHVHVEARGGHRVFHSRP